MVLLQYSNIDSATSTEQGLTIDVTLNPFTEEFRYVTSFYIKSHTTDKDN
jgi:hypothetical protein